MEFIEQCVEVLFEGILAFGRYMEALATNGRVTSGLLVYGPVMAMDYARNTERVLEEFYKSPEAAYLTAADREDDDINAVLGRGTRRRVTCALRNPAWGVPVP